MKKILCFLLAAVMLAALCSCGEPKEMPPYTDAGYYEVFTVDDGNRLLTKSDFDEMGWTIFLQLNNDGTGVFNYNNADVKALTWYDGVINNGSADMLYILVGGMLTLDLSSNGRTFVIVFRKSTPPQEILEIVTPRDPAEAETAETAKPVRFDPVSGKVSGGRVTILSAERFRDYRGRDAVRFYYDFAYSGSTLTTVDELLSCLAVEDGVELSTASASYANDVPEYGNESRTIEPDVTIRCIAEYSYKTSGSELRFTVSDGNNGEVSAVFDPQSLPGRPGSWMPKTIEKPRLYRKYNLENTTETASIAITDTERVPSDIAYSYADVIRVYVDFTNLGSDAAYFESDYSLSAYQDGIELDVGTAAEQASSYGNGYLDIDPGDSITVSRCWTLRSESPVEIVVTEWRSQTVICAGTFSVASE